MWGSYESDSGVEKTPARRGADDFLNATEFCRTRGGRIASRIVSSNWAIEGRIGLVKKTSGDRSLREKRTWIEPAHPSISIQRQGDLLGLSRASYSYQAQGERPENLELMRLIDEEFTRHPFYGVERMTVSLGRQGHRVKIKRVRRLMRQMGLEAISPKPKLSQAHPEQRGYPYLLRDVQIVRPNQVWSTDITSIRLLHGFVYLVAIMDWVSRYVLSWEVFISLDTAFCLVALEHALQQARPEIFTRDQGGAVYEPRVYRAVTGGGDCDQYGWTGTGL